MTAPMIPVDDRPSFWSGFRFNDLQARTMHAIELVEAKNGLADFNDVTWLQLVMADAFLLRAEGLKGVPDQQKITEMLIQLESTILRWRDNRRRRHWQAHDCTHELPSWAGGEGPDRCPWCGRAFGADVVASYEDAATILRSETLEAAT